MAIALAPRSGLGLASRQGIGRNNDFMTNKGEIIKIIKIKIFIIINSVLMVYLIVNRILRVFKGKLIITYHKNKFLGEKNR
jgi:hypothetical protein